MKYDVVVIGAGASGMMAAIQAAKNGKKTVVLEVLARPGKKILVTGNGKCNLTNYKIDDSCYHTDSGDVKDIMRVIGRFDARAVTDFFREEGMLVRDRDGYVYPYSEQASSVLDCLRQCLVRYGVELICGCEIASVKKSGNEFIVSGMIRDVEAENRRADAKKDGSKKKAKDKASANDVAAMRKFSCISDELIVATGSAAGGVCNQGMARKGVEAAEPNCELGYNIARGFGHHIVKLLPALVSLVCSEGFFKEISGVRAKGSVRLIIDGECAASDRGELQLTDNGISGIPVFQVSRYAVAALDSGKKRVQAELDFMLEYGEKELSEYIDKLKSDMKRIHGGSSYDNEAALTETLTGLVNRKLMGLFIRLSGGRTAELVKLLKHFTVEVVDFKGTQSAQVCSGGVRLDEIDIANMESKLCHGLYFCGEVLDVDGCCGGYNLQWAWSSGYAAGQS